MEKIYNKNNSAIYSAFWNVYRVPKVFHELTLSCSDVNHPFNFPPLTVLIDCKTIFVDSNSGAAIAPNNNIKNITPNIMYGTMSTCGP